MRGVLVAAAAALVGCQGELIETPIRVFVPDFANQVCLASDFADTAPVDAVVVDVFTFEGSPDLYEGRFTPCHRCAVEGPESARCTRIARRCLETAPLPTRPGLEVGLEGLTIPDLPGEQPVCLRISLWSRGGAPARTTGWRECGDELPFDGAPQWCLTSDLGNLGGPAGQPLVVREAVCPFYEIAFAVCGRSSGFECSSSGSDEGRVPGCAAREGRAPRPSNCSGESDFCDGRRALCLAGRAPVSLSQCLAF